MNDQDKYGPALSGRGARAQAIVSAWVALFMMAVSSVPLAAEPKSANVPQQHRSLTELLVEKAKGLVAKQPDRYARTISRGSKLRDAVLQLRNGRLDLRPVFDDIGQSRHYLKLHPLEGGFPARAAVHARLFVWDAASREPSSVEGLREGLYELFLVRPTKDGYRATGTSAWVLIVDQERYERTNAAFRDAKIMVQGRAGSVEPDAIPALLRACLEVLAQR